MRSYRFVSIVILVGLIIIPLVRADYYVSTDKSAYRIGETITVHVTTEGGRITLVLEGPSTINMNLGDLPEGSYAFPIGEAEPQDVGYWTITLRVEACAGFCLYDSSNPPKTYFQVVPEKIPEFPPGALLPLFATTLLAATVLARRSRSSR